MNTGMQDAFNLAWKIALVQRGEGQEKPLLDSYSLERSEVGDQVLRDAKMFTTVATLRNSTALWLRDHLAPILGSFQFARDKIRDEWFEFSINYRHSPLSAEKWPTLTGGLAAGDRLCDAPVTSAADGKPTTLFAALRGTRHTLLLLPGVGDAAAIGEMLKISDEASRAFPNVLAVHVVLKSESAAAAKNVASGVPVWVDIRGRVHEKLHAGGRSLFVVRPDGYIGYRCQPADGKALLDYLGRFLVRKN
jgi:hypothetical protein